MTDDTSAPQNAAPQNATGADSAPRKPLSEAAQRALAEAEARRAAIDAAQKGAPKEYSGRGGLEPVRYGDWEVGGIASDF